jgi:transposase-like protein
MIEVSTGRVIMIPVEKRSSDDLIPIIEKWIEKGSTIVSDYWRAYDCLGHKGWQHLKVNHKLNFKDPETGACTNTIEAEWRHAKAYLPEYRRKKEYYPLYLAKYMFMRSCRIRKVDPMLAFFQAAGTLYDARRELTVEVEELRRELSDEEVNEEVEIANEHSIDNYFVATESQSSESQSSTQSTSGAGISK